MRLLLNALSKYVAGLALVGLLLFLPAGTLRFGNGWLFMALLFIPILLLGSILFFKAPELLKKRLDVKEKQSTQKGVVALSGLIFVIGFAAAGLDFRFNWSHVPPWLTAASSLILLLAYGLYAEVMRENAYLSRTIEVQEGQKVIDTGLYGIIRHPMYAATILLYLSIPLVLGSWFSFLVFLLYPLVIVLRIGNEEKVLEQGLAGYGDYKKKVRYRLFPFLW